MLRVLVLVLVDNWAPSAPIASASPPFTLIKGWRVISKIYSSVPLASEQSPNEGPQAVTPRDFARALKAVWDDYVGAGRACNGQKMAKVFHPQATLTFASDQGVIVIGCEAFCSRVAQRWSMPQHQPFVHLHEQGIAGSADTILGLEFADNPNVALATLRIGFPPVLYTDLLSMLCANGRWWVVAKSSCSVPFLLDEKR